MNILRAKLVQRVIRASWTDEERAKRLAFQEPGFELPRVDTQTNGRVIRTQSNDG